LARRICGPVDLRAFSMAGRPGEELGHRGEGGASSRWELGAKAGALLRKLDDLGLVFAEAGFELAVGREQRGDLFALAIEDGLGVIAGGVGFRTRW